MAQTGKLGKDEPHPVALFTAAAQFLNNAWVDRSLRIDKPLEVEHIGHGAETAVWWTRRLRNVRWLSRIFTCAAGRSNQAARSISGKARVFPLFGGHSISNVLLVIASASSSPSTANAATRLPQRCRMSPSGSRGPARTEPVSSRNSLRAATDASRPHPFRLLESFRRPRPCVARKARPDAPAGLPTRTCPPVSEFPRSKPCISIGKGIAKDEAASDAFCIGNTVARGLQSALFLGCWLFVLIRRLGWHVAWLGFVCRLGAFLVRGLLLAPFVKNDTVAFFVCWHG
jgi:hypothetical protein